MGNGKVSDPVKPCPKTLGAIVASITRTDASQKKGTVGKPLKNVRFNVVETAAEKKSGGSGAAEFSKLPPKTYTVTAALADDQKSEFEIEETSRSVVVTPKSKGKAEFKAARLASARVHVTGSGADRAGVHVKITGPKTVTLDTNGQGIADFGKVPIGDYTVQITFDPDDASDKEFAPPKTAPTFTLARSDQVTKDVALVPKVPLKVKVLRQQPDVLHLHQAHVALTGPKSVSVDTDASGVADFGKLPPGDYQATVTYVGGDANDLAHYPPLAPSAINLASGGPAVLHEVPVESKILTVNVVRKNPDKKLANVGVKAGTSTADTDVNGAATCLSVQDGPNDVTLELRGEDAKDYELPAKQTVTLSRGGNRSITIELKPKLSPVFIKLALAMPDGTEHLLPEGLPVKLLLDDGTTVEGKLDEKSVVVGSDGSPGPKVDRTKKVSLLIPAAADKYLVCEKAGDAATQELVTDAAPKIPDSEVGKAIVAGKRALLLPQKDWKLIETTCEAKPAADNFEKAAFAFKGADSIGTAEAPVTVVVKPAWTHARLEFFDRKYGKSDHAGKRVSIPPVLVKAVRKSADGAMAKAETASNCVAHADDAAKTCQAVPWIVTKTADGADLPKLDKELLLEFGVEKGWVVSTSATARKIEILDPVADKDKLKPGPDRPKYYDLPKVWRSRNYYARLPGDTGKFFDELSEAEIEASLDSAKPFVFSLDDVVLVTNAGSQAVTDKSETGADEPLSKYSRMAVLYFDPDDKYAIKVHDPRPKAAYHSKTEFTKEAGADTRRNVVTTLPGIARAIMFCNGMYDVHDKRTATADFTKKEVLGARAGKLDDADISAKRRLDQSADVDEGYVHRTRLFDLYYLHYGGTDGTSVFGGVVTTWSARFFHLTGDAPGGWDHTKSPLSNNVTDTRHYREEGLAHAMERWNGKGYQFEESDDKTDVVVKSFYFFEAKDVEEPSGTFVKRGGLHSCIVGLGTDAKGSWATDDTMFMRRSGYRDEGKGWGSLPAAEARATDYDGTTAAPRCALAHELGHAAVGLWDDYITETDKDFGSLPTYKTQQRYPGMPFKRDESSIMSVNQAVRLRTFWGRARWLNDEAKAGKSLHKFLDGKQLKPTYAPAGKTKLGYQIDAKAFYKPAHTEANVSLGEKGRCDLHLYQLGDDEFAQLLKGGPYKGILVLDTHICMKFKPGPNPGQTWSDEDKADWATDLNKAIVAMLEGPEGKFRLTSAAANKFSKTYVRVFPQWRTVAPAAGAPAGTHFTVSVTKDGSSLFSPSNTTIEVGNACVLASIIRYMYGQLSDDESQWAMSPLLGDLFAAQSLTDDIAEDDLAKVKQWVDAKAAGTFTVEDIT